MPASCWKSELVSRCTFHDEQTIDKPFVLFITQNHMSKLSSANASRCNGSTNGFGSLSGSIPSDDLRSVEEIDSTHNTLKLMHKAQRISDWVEYSRLQATLSFN